MSLHSILYNGPLKAEKMAGLPCLFLINLFLIFLISNFSHSLIHFIIAMSLHSILYNGPLKAEKWQNFPVQRFPTSERSLLCFECPRIPSLLFSKKLIIGSSKLKSWAKSITI
jgi:hypothetical protein